MMTARVPGARDLGNNDNRAFRIPIINGPSDSHAILSILDALAYEFGKLPAIREFTVALLNAANIKNNDVTAQVTHLMGFVRSRLTYVRDPNGTEYVVSPVRLLSQINTDGRAMGDCDDHTLLFNAMLNSIGFRVRAVGVRLYENRYDHVISSVLVGNHWIDIDTCIKSGQQPRYEMRLVGGISA